MNSCFLRTSGPGGACTWGGAAPPDGWARKSSDSAGLGPQFGEGARVAPTPPARVWSGHLFEPGLWQFVAELRSPRHNGDRQEGPREVRRLHESACRDRVRSTSHSDRPRHDMDERHDPFHPGAGVRPSGRSSDHRARHARAGPRAAGCDRGGAGRQDHGGRASGCADRDDLRGGRRRAVRRLLGRARDPRPGANGDGRRPGRECGAGDGRCLWGRGPS